MGTRAEYGVLYSRYDLDKQIARLRARGVPGLRGAEVSRKGRGDPTRPAPSLPRSIDCRAPVETQNA